MTDPRISVHDRVRALQALEHLAWQMNQAAHWLGEAGMETEADMIEQAARSVLASCWLLERPIRPQVPPGRWQQPACPAPNGYPQPR